MQTQTIMKTKLLTSDAIGGTVLPTLDSCIQLYKEQSKYVNHFCFYEIDGYIRGLESKFSSIACKYPLMMDEF